MAGIHVLVVEDHPDTREMWESVLAYSGALVTAASCARQAVQFCASLRPDVIVTDLSMPGEDGVWLAEQLRAQDERLPIIAVSGYSRIFGDRLKVTRFTRILQKPIDPWQLVAAVAA